MARSDKSAAKKDKKGWSLTRRFSIGGSKKGAGARAQNRHLTPPVDTEAEEAHEQHDSLPAKSMKRTASAATNSSSSTAGTMFKIRVVVRVRPLFPAQIEQGEEPIVSVMDRKLVIVGDPYGQSVLDEAAHRTREKRYTFDAALGPDAAQNDVHRESAAHVVPGVLKGMNATVFAYGATGSGKTHTLLGTKGTPGVMFTSLRELFARLDALEGRVGDITLSYTEVYNEVIRDLLTEDRNVCDLREDPVRGPVIAGVEETPVSSAEEVVEQLHIGNARRTVEPTKANEVSSRSHAVLQVRVSLRDSAPDRQSEILVGKLSMIDLAGSERATSTENRGVRLQEGSKINRSLLALANCINALGDKNKKGSYVPFRDSKLTRLLKDSLGGNCHTVMIATVSAFRGHYEETVNTLKYAARAKTIRTRVAPNVKMVNHHITEYENIIQQLRGEIVTLRAKMSHVRWSSEALEPPPDPTAEPDDADDAAAPLPPAATGGESAPEDTGLSLRVDTSTVAVHRRDSPLSARTRARTSLDLSDMRRLQKAIQGKFSDVLEKRRMLLDVQEQNVDNGLEIARLERVLETVGQADDEPPMENEIAILRENIDANNHLSVKMRSELAVLETELGTIRDGLARDEGIAPERREFLTMLFDSQDMQLSNLQLSVDVRMREKVIAVMQDRMALQEQVLRRYNLEREVEELPPPGYSASGGASASSGPTARRLSQRHQESAVSEAMSSFLAVSVPDSSDSEVSRVSGGGGRGRAAEERRSGEAGAEEAEASPTARSRGQSLFHRLFGKRAAAPAAAALDPSAATAKGPVRPRAKNAKAAKTSVFEGVSLAQKRSTTTPEALDSAHKEREDVERGEVVPQGIVEVADDEFRRGSRGHMQRRTRPGPALAPQSDEDYSDDDRSEKQISADGASREKESHDMHGSGSESDDEHGEDDDNDDLGSSGGDAPSSNAGDADAATKVARPEKSGTQSGKSKRSAVSGHGKKSSHPSSRRGSTGSSASTAGSLAGRRKAMQSALMTYPGPSRQVSTGSKDPAEEEPVSARTRRQRTWKEESERARRRAKGDAPARAATKSTGSSASAAPTPPAQKAKHAPHRRSALLTVDPVERSVGKEPEDAESNADMGTDDADVERVLQEKVDEMVRRRLSEVNLDALVANAVERRVRASFGGSEDEVRQAVRDALQGNPGGGDAEREDGSALSADRAETSAAQHNEEHARTTYDDVADNEDDAKGISGEGEESGDDASKKFAQDDGSGRSAGASGEEREVGNEIDDDVAKLGGEKTEANTLSIELSDAELGAASRSVDAGTQPSDDAGEGAGNSGGTTPGRSTAAIAALFEQLSSDTKSMLHTSPEDDTNEASKQSPKVADIIAKHNGDASVSDL